MARQILDRLLLGKDPELGCITERGSQQLGVEIVNRAPDDLGDLLVRQNTQSTEIDNHRDVLAKSGNAGCQRVAVAIELGTDANLQLLRRHRERLVKRLDLHRVGMLGCRLLVLEDHDAVICHLLLAEDCPLGSVDNEIAQRIVSTLTVLLQAHRVVLQQTQRRSQHNRKLAKTDPLKHPRLLVKGIQHRALVGPCNEADVHIHLRCVSEVADTCLHREHGLHTTGGLLDARLDIADVLKR